MAFLNIKSHINIQDTHGTKIQGSLSVIDYIIISDKGSIQNVKVLPGVSLDSDHRLVIRMINIRSRRRQRTEKRKMIKTKTSRDEDTDMR